MAIDEYFLCCSDWKSQGGRKRCQCIYMCILLVRYMVDVEVSKLFRHVDCWIVIGHQVFMSDFVLFANLIDDEL